MKGTIGLNVTHDASLCHCVDGEIKLFIEEERLSRKKHDSIPIKAIFEYLEKDKVGITGLEYSDYDFISNKGYGTKNHLLALKKIGPCKIHRKTFAKVND